VKVVLPVRVVPALRVPPVPLPVLVLRVLALLPVVGFIVPAHQVVLPVLVHQAVPVHPPVPAHQVVLPVLVHQAVPVHLPVPVHQAVLPVPVPQVLPVHLPVQVLQAAHQVPAVQVHLDIVLLVVRVLLLALLVTLRHPLLNRMVEVGCRDGIREFLFM